MSDQSENEQTDVQQHPERGTRPQPERERAPDTLQKTQEREGRSEWSGGWAGGGTWGGRSR